MQRKRKKSHPSKTSSCSLLLLCLQLSSIKKPYVLSAYTKKGMILPCETLKNVLKPPQEKLSIRHRCICALMFRS